MARGSVSRLDHPDVQLPVPRHQNLVRAIKWAPWIIFGPITGLLTNRAATCFRRQERVLGWLYIVLNLSILVALPLVTAKLASRL